MTIAERPQSPARRASSPEKSGHAINNGKVDKIGRYGWRLLDGPGKLEWVHKDELSVDPTYQRDESEEKVLRIAAEWSWMACGVLSVARRGGKLYVFEGNHRAVAARRRSDIAELPCVVFESTDVVAEAAGFLRANTNRKPISGLDRFKAQLATGDPAAALVDELVSGSGYTFSRESYKGRVIRCASAMMKNARLRPDSLRLVWPLVIEVAADGPIMERVVDPISYVEHRLSSDEGGASLLRNPWKARILKLGTQGLVDAANLAASYYARGGEKTWSIGLVDALNKGVQNRLKVPGLKADD